MSKIQWGSFLGHTMFLYYDVNNLVSCQLIDGMLIWIRFLC